MRVGLVVNEIDAATIEALRGDGALYKLREFDSSATIVQLKGALEAQGHEVFLFHGDERFFFEFPRLKNDIDLAWSIAEGWHGRSREAQIPAMFEFLNIPFVGSDSVTLGVALDKSFTKQVLRAAGVRTAPWCVVRHAGERVHGIQFPAVVKPVHEGSQIGLDAGSLVYSHDEARAQLETLFQSFGGPAMVEEFLSGTEYTIPIIGNEPLVPLPIVEVAFDDGATPLALTDLDTDVVALMGEGTGAPREHHDAKLPEGISPERVSALTETALAAYRALECRDWCRVDVRLDVAGQPHVLELNPIAGIDPSYYFAWSAAQAGISYSVLVGAIVDAAVRRYGLQEVGALKEVEKRCLVRADAG